MNVAKVLSKNLLQINAIKLSPQTPFQWASGLYSPIYCDNRITLGYPEVRDRICDGFVDLVNQYQGISCIVGVATAGIAHGALLASKMNLPFAYVRSKAKAHGRQNIIEGIIKEDDQCIVIEDLISTGGSAITAAHQVEETGAKVHAVLSIFSYNLPAATQNFDECPYTYQSLANYDQLIAIAEEDGVISKEQLGLLSKWKEDPSQWSNNFEQSHTQ